MDYLAAHTSLSPIWRGFTPSFVNYKKGCTRLAATSDKVYQLLAHGRGFSLGTPTSSTTKTGRHDIAESSIKHQKSTNSIATCSRASKTYLRLSDFKLIPANLQIQYCYLYSNARQKKISIECRKRKCLKSAKIEILQKKNIVF